MAAKAAEKVAPKKQLRADASGKAVAAALTQAFPKDCERIVSIMRDAATSASMRRKLGRVALALDLVRKDGKQ